MADEGRPPSNAVAGPSTPPAPADLDTFWSQAAADARPRISEIRRRLPHFPSASLRIQRVSQLDAELLDEELLSLLIEPVKSSLAQIKTTLPDRVGPELLALLRLVLFKYSIWDNGASYGAMLQNLRYRNEWAHRGGLQSTFLSARLSRVQLCLYPLLTIGIPYGYERLSRHMTSLSFSSMEANDPRRLLWSLIDKLQRTYEAAAFLNFAAFLSDGKYRTLADRLLGMRLTYHERTLNRNVSFEFLNRQLVWHAFTEFLLFLLPIIRPKRLLRRLMRLPTHPRILAFWLAVLPRWLARRVGLYRDPHTGRPKYRLPINLPLVTGPAEKGQNGGGSGSTAAGKYNFLPDGICAICWERIESEVSSSHSSVSMGNVGIPSSDPLDPSSGALAPSSSQSATLPSSTTNYHSASRNFGVSQDGIPYSNALIHTAYAAKPCGCEYCYVCLAEKLLSEEAGEELEDSAAGGDSESAGSSEDAKRHTGKGKRRPPVQKATVGAWDCLKCGSKVRGMGRAVVASEDCDNDDERKVGHARGAEKETSVQSPRSQVRKQRGVATSRHEGDTGGGDENDEAELDLDELTHGP